MLKLFKRAFSEDIPCSSPPPARPDPPVGCAAMKRRHRLSSGEPSRLIRSFGRKGHKPGQLTTPTGVAVTKSGDVVVVDSENSRLQVFTDDGRLKLVIGRKGSMPHELNHPMGVALTRDAAQFQNIVVTDSVNACVKIWQQDGKFVTEFAQNGVFDFPYGVATSTSHHIVVTDLCQHCVTVLHPTGCLRNKFGSYGDKVHQFDHPYSLAIDRQDHIYVSDSGNSCVKSFNLDGKILQYFNMEDFRLLDESYILLQGITVDSSGHVLVIGNSSIYICAQNGRLWEVIIPSEEGEDLHSPKCLAHSPLGQIVVTQVGGLDSRHEVSVFQYHTEDYHSLKCVPYLTYEGRMKQQSMRKAKSLDSAPPPPTCSKYFSSHVNGYVAPLTKKAASQKIKSSKSKSSHRKSLQEDKSAGRMTDLPVVVVNGDSSNKGSEDTETSLHKDKVNVLNSSSKDLNDGGMKEMVIEMANTANEDVISKDKHPNIKVIINCEEDLINS